ncbi:MAG: hypothetical protein BXU00_02345 [Candidatus Nanoclepta minutus]|uniref:Archaeal Type IV pilin N-terminal domain-containing protein n=1 Tax=Candidatus Nanoclepta minutus TaxID=1940235 RepID=A0A397WQI0_9ARCH|nr:MAG: hypothetical protein BXU00_02345 [Candidatus Nanoclepta minutus]
MKIRGVSPLIATIILIALTVSIGAIIVGWGRSYIQKQMICAGMSASLNYKNYSYSGGNNPKIISFDILNSGESVINLRNAYIKITSIDETSDICSYGTGGCSFVETLGSNNIVPSNFTSISLTVTSISPIYNKLSGATVELYDKTCNTLLASTILPYSIS